MGPDRKPEKVSSNKIGRRGFLIGSAASALSLAACDYQKLIPTSGEKPQDIGQQRGDVKAIAADLVSSKYKIAESEGREEVDVNFPINQRTPNGVYGQVLFSTPGADNYFGIGVDNKYISRQVVESDVNIGGGLYQPDAKVVVRKTEEAGEVIPADKLEQVARAVLDLSRATEVRLVKVKYAWGEVDAVSVKGFTLEGRKFEGYFDAKGQGMIKVTPQFPFSSSPQK